MSWQETSPRRAIIAQPRKDKSCCVARICENTWRDSLARLLNRLLNGWVVPTDNVLKPFQGREQDLPFQIDPIKKTLIGLGKQLPTLMRAWEKGSEEARLARIVLHEAGRIRHHL